MCRAGSSVEDWWTMCIPSSPSGAKTSPGPFKQWTKNKRWEIKIMMRFPFSKEGRMKYGSNSIQDAAKRPERFRYRWSYFFFVKQLLKAYGELCDVIRGLMQSSFPWSRLSGGEVLNGGMPHHTEGMRGDPTNQTRWKHKWKWHNRGNVWDKIATGWAGEDDWISNRKNKTSSATRPIL